MISFKLMAYCVVAAGSYLLLVTLLLNWIERRLHLSRGLPAELLESSGLAWTLMNFVMESLFYVVIPTIAYSFFYLIIPLSGGRAGMSAALFAFALGAAPALMGLTVHIRLPMPFVMFQLLAVLLKLGGSLTIIGLLYAL